MKGAIRVFARIRPKVPREADQEVAVWRKDAFSLESAAKDKKSSPKDYNFDAVFDEHNSQEDVFADCRGLIASAVDGFNDMSLANIPSLVKNSRLTLKFLTKLSDLPKRQLQVFHQLQANQVQVNTFHYNVLMNSRAKIGEWPLALVHFSFMRTIKVQVDLPSFNSLASPGDWTFSLFMRQSALHDSFNENLIGSITAISSCAEFGLWQRGFQCKETLPKLSRWFSWNQSCEEQVGEFRVWGAHVATPAAARKLLEDLSDLAATQAFATLRCQASKINACEKASNWLGAFRCFEWMRVLRQRPNRITFNSLSSAMKGQWWKSLWAFSTADSPNRISFNAFLSCCEKGAEWSQALKCLSTSFYYRAADLLSFNSGISACAQADFLRVDGSIPWIFFKDFKETEGSKKMRLATQLLSAAWIDDQIGACDQKGKWIAILQLLTSMNLAFLAPNQICCNAAISGFETGSQWQRAIDGVMQLFASSNADEQSFASGISACTRMSQSYWSLRLLKLMDANRFPSNEICRSDTIESCDKSGQAIEELRGITLKLILGCPVGSAGKRFAYGQTGAGKTHTMYGSDAMPGLVPRAAEELFSVLRRYAHECDAKVVCSMFELYRDDLVDLLFTKAKGKVPPTLDIKKDPRGTVKVDNAVEIEVANPEDLQKAIMMGMDRRHVAATKMNADSSRSHLIFIVTIECTNKKSKQVSSGKLTLCDLAGSERLKKSEVTGEQMKEAQSINKSLTALGDVIEALTKGQKHVPYRNHRLTQLLSDSLGGNAKTLMFVNCSPASGNLDETAAALAYAVRAKNIVNKVEKNSDSQEVARLKKVIQMLSTELEQARKSGAALPELGEKDAPELEESEMPAESTAKNPGKKKTVVATRVGRFDPPIVT
eukprot:symbB.v1.2.003073.t3/scaffold169.1/size288995/1